MHDPRHDDPPPTSDAWPQEWHPFRWRDYEEERPLREARYHGWCVWQGRDPESADSAAEYERWFAQAATNDPDYWLARGYA